MTGTTKSAALASVDRAAGKYVDKVPLHIRSKCRSTRVLASASAVMGDR